ncbi:MAG: hypothetical protein IT467_03925 [Dokdonella sp.]|uniref:hypothetical protein n=1 Tax=Dokdonella sp. TaxID=2291710 RepID=UPI0025C01DA9|nr:hypothetical protein [Dokdonella sp.]MBZ0223516.1 hypothetical protein [Dokdonella sp.]MCC7255063.1 hypothetical protein [Dokdonella sp.]
MIQSTRVAMALMQPPMPVVELLASRSLFWIWESNLGSVSEHPIPRFVRTFPPVQATPKPGDQSDRIQALDQWSVI